MRMPHPGAALFSERARREVAAHPLARDVIESLLIAEGIELRRPADGFAYYFTNEHEATRLLLRHGVIRAEQYTRESAYAIEDLRRRHAQFRFTGRDGHAKLRADLLGEEGGDS